MSRYIIDPPKKQWDLLPQQLTPGEYEVFELFDVKLPPEWEMYVQPHLNGLRPDLVLLNPYAGIAVYEIKDWNLTSIQYSIQSNQISRNPLKKIKLYEEQLLELYCPRLNDRFGRAAKQAITAGLIFTQVPHVLVENLLIPFRAHHYPKMDKYQQYYPLVGMESLVESDLDTLFPQCKNWGRQNPSSIMSEDIADDLRSWLKDPAFSQEQRKPLELDEHQRRIATTRTETGYRRVKGPAGSGKSLVLAARAAELARDGKRVLVCTYNITLMNYLRDLVARHARDLAARQGTRPKVIRQQIEFFNFHYWCRLVCIHTGHEKRYKQLWATYEDEEVLKYHLAELVQRIYDPSIEEEDEYVVLSDAPPRYDAILVDEGQDYELPWWHTLRKAVEQDGGEMLLVADKTQNIHGTAEAWTEETMIGSGFRGPWVELKISYRLPPLIIPILEKFIADFPIEEADIPDRCIAELDLYPIELRPVHVPSGMPIVEIVDICFKEVRLQMRCLKPDTAIPDITFLAQNNDMGRAFVKRCEQEGIHIVHTFSQDGRDSRSQKLAFFQGDARVKATTLHSFKGWEARHLVLYVSRITSPEDRALFYTALTRLKRHTHGSMLTVISSCPDLYDFLRKQGEQEGEYSLHR